jgi:DNA-3-methyladenine glycosylase II
MSPATHEEVLARLGAKCRYMRHALKTAGVPPPRVRAPGFAALVHIIVEQQVSVASGAAIWARLEQGLGGAVTPAAVLAHDAAGLTMFGLSRPKARYIHGLAQAVADGAIDLAAIAQLDDAAAIAALTALKGIGRWTAEIYLMFALGRPDLWPAFDIALAEGAARLLGLPARPDFKTLDEIGKRWAPHRSAAALVLWRYYSHSLSTAKA